MGATAEQAGFSLWWDVSIHAPVMGATYQSGVLATAVAESFNPRARDGRDLRTQARLGLALQFQSTRP